MADGEWRVLIVDDEPPARDLLRMLCADRGLAVVGEATTGEDAIRLANQLRPNLVLLDISMPGMGGMAAARQITAMATPPAIVFTTAFEGYALAAFDVGAVDYLLKPIVDVRFSTMLDRVDTAKSNAAQKEDHIWVSIHSELRRVSLGDIELVTAERDYVRLEIQGRSHLLRATMDEMLTKLNPVNFLRIHRSTIIRSDLVIGLHHEGGGVWSASLAGGKKVRVGRSYYETVRSKLAR